MKFFALFNELPVFSVVCIMTILRLSAFDIITSGGSFSSLFSHPAKGQCQCFGSFATQNISLSLSYPNCPPATPRACEPLDTRPVLDWALNALWLPHFSQTPCSCSHCGGRRSALPLILQASRCCPALGWLHISEGVCPRQWLIELRQAFHKGKLVAKLNAGIPSQGSDLPSCSRPISGLWYKKYVCCNLLSVLHCFRLN